MPVQDWKHFFKAEIRSSGLTLLSQDKVSIAQPSDTEIIGYIRISPPLKVSLKSKSISSSTLFADCNCPAGKKNVFCKHIWAVLLATEQKNPDFFDEKIELEKTTSTAQKTEKVQPTIQSNTYADKQAAYKEQQKEKQSLYRKIQYQKQKLRKNDYKKSKESSSEQPELPFDVEKALNYFSQNGFDLKESLSNEALATAKKKLSRIFHPDYGGSHEEILELNRCSEIIAKFLKHTSK